MKLLITGSRDANITMREYAHQVVAKAKALGYIILTGDASGIDAEVIAACDQLEVPIEVHGALNTIRERTKTGTNIPHDCDFSCRDELLADECDACFAIWNGTSQGTLVTLTLARRARKPTWLFKVDHLVDTQ